MEKYMTRSIDDCVYFMRGDFATVKRNKYFIPFHIIIPLLCIFAAEIPQEKINR